MTEAILEPDPEDNTPAVPKDRASRQKAAVALKIAGANYSEIAETLGYSGAAVARKAVEQALAETVEDDEKEQLRFLEGRRLERLLRGLWQKATNPKHPEQLAAARTALAVIAQHSKLYGLDAPTQVEVRTPTRMELEEWVAATAQHAQGMLPEERDIVDAETVEDDEEEDEEDEQG